MLHDECVLGEGWVAVGNGDHHGDAAGDRNLYIGPCRLRYHRGGTAAK